jgi:hypothetical protein
LHKFVQRTFFCSCLNDNYHVNYRLSTWQIFVVLLPPVIQHTCRLQANDELHLLFHHLETYPGSHLSHMLTCCMYFIFMIIIYNTHRDHCFLISSGFKGGFGGFSPHPRRKSQAHILTYAFQGYLMSR